MPELPEVETIRRGLQPVLVGARIAKAETFRADLRFPFPARFVERLTGARVEGLERRAKFLLAALSTGETLIAHLGMTGRFVIEHGESPQTPGRFHHETPRLATHDHLRLRLQTAGGPAAIIYNDVRRFGFMDLVATAEREAHPSLAGLGPEPLGNDFHAAALLARFEGRRTPLKSALLDQRTIAGLGNIYVCEALHRAGISPDRPAGDLEAREGETLVAAIRDVLTEALEAGGSTLRDYVHADGSLGYFQHAFRVYDREGEPCPRDGCGGRVARKAQAGRSTFFCAACQG